MRKLLAGAVFTAATLAVIATAAIGAGGQPVALGSYVAAPDVKPGQTYQQGGWKVIKEGGKRKIVRDDQYNGIYYPDPGKCDNYSLPLAAQSIPISKTGRFHITEDTPVGNGTSVHVDWKGHWTTAKRVKGTIELGYKNCSKTIDWKGSPGS